jgi:hypothetical protein
VGGKGYPAKDAGVYVLRLSKATGPARLTPNGRAGEVVVRGPSPSAREESSTRGDER